MVTFDEMLKTNIASALVVGLRFLSYDQETGEWVVEDLSLPQENQETYRGASLQQAADRLLAKTKAR